MILEVHRNPHPRSSHPSHQPLVQLQVQVDHSPHQPGHRSEVININIYIYIYKVVFSVCVYVRL